MAGSPRVEIFAICYLHQANASTVSAGERERGVELETALRVEQDRAADLIGKLTFYGNAYQKLQGKLTGTDLQPLCWVAICHVSLSLHVQKLSELWGYSF